MPKRPRNIFDTPAASSPPDAKRVHLTASSVSSAHSSPLKPFHLVPADSPSNPFSLRLNNVVTLPRAVSFAKYFALRFQLVSCGGTKSTKGSSTYRRLTAETYRIVHVPPNYSFKLLYKLLRFLFDFEAGPDHVFEVQDGVEMYATSSNKTGRVKKGRTCVKLSRNFDDQLKRAGNDKRRKKSTSEDKDACQWEGEDDFTIATAWPDGLVHDRAIIYRHDSEQTVHITMNTLKFPQRNGLSNRPFVFLAEDADDEVRDYGYWNRGKSFERFLRNSVERNPEDEVEENDDDDDDLPRSVPSSDPLTPETPYPSAPLLQMRLESAHRRMSRKVPKFKDEIDDSSSEEETKKEPEVHGEDWDPFGDEAEL